MPGNSSQGHHTRWYQRSFAIINSDSSDDDSDTESVVLSHSTPTPTSTWEELSPPGEPPNAVTTESINTRIDRLRFPPPLPPPPPPFLPLPSLLFPPSPPQLPSTSIPLADAFGIESQRVTYQPPSPSQAFVDHNPLGSSFLMAPGWHDEAESDCLQVPDGVISAIRMVNISGLHERDKLSHCPICMEEIKEGDQACQLPCNHTYCSECIIRWLNNNKTCPVCRLQLDGWEGCSDSRDDDSLEHPEPEIPLRENHSAWDYFFPSVLPVPENSAGDNSDEADYDSACDELGDSHEDEDMVDASHSGRG